MQLDYTVKSSHGYEETVQAAVREVEKVGYRVMAVHDVAATLAEKGFEREAVSIIETCNARHASKVLAADVKIGLMLPCPIMVYEQQGEVFVSTMKPTLIAAFFPQADLGEAPQEVEEALVGAMEAAAR